MCLRNVAMLELASQPSSWCMLLEQGYGLSNRGRKQATCTQAAPDHPDFANGPAGKQNGQQKKHAHRQPLEAPLCVLVEHLSRLVHDLQPGVLLDGRVHVMLQKALQKACGGRQRVALWRLCQAQKVKLLRNPPLSSLQAGALQFSVFQQVNSALGAACCQTATPIAACPSARGCQSPRNCLVGWSLLNSCSAT